MSHSWHHNEHVCSFSFPARFYFLTVIHILSSVFTRYNNPANTSNPLHNPQFSEKYLHRKCLNFCDHILNICNIEHDAQNAKYSVNMTVLMQPLFKSQFAADNIRHLIPVIIRWPFIFRLLIIKQFCTRLGKYHKIRGGGGGRRRWHGGRTYWEQSFFYALQGLQAASKYIQQFDVDDTIVTCSKPVNKLYTLKHQEKHEKITILNSLNY